jgi:HD-like signal output (HDOD) protein
MEPMLTAKPLQELIAEQIAAGDLQLPVFNPVALRLQQALNDDDITIEDIEAIIMEDQALASQILRMANAAFYRGLSQIATINRAIIRLGAQQVANLAMVVAQRQSYSSDSPLLSRYMKMLWGHAFASAIGCRWLAQRCGYMSQAEVGFLAGLLHDIGKLVILKVLEKLCENDAQLTLADSTVLEMLDSALHTEHGYNLMQTWNLPEQYSVIARDHHLATADNGDTLLLIVRLVDRACNKLGIGTCHEPELVLAATPEAHLLGLSEIQLAELEIQLEDSLRVELS